jgi:transcription antitermination factor NusA-like protein
VVLSMTIPALVPGVVRDEVPEIQDGLVEIKSVARLAGKLSKVTVATTDPSVADAVSACVGEDYDRLRRIRERCGGEIIQFIHWSENEEEIIKAALFPAHVTRVEKSFPEGSNRPKYTAFVSEFDLRRAIGAGGSNVKLCAALTNSFVVVEADEEANNASRRHAFNDDLDDSFGGGGGGFWGDEREDDGFDARDAEQFANVMNNDRFGERRDGIALDDLGWPDLDDNFDDLPSLNPRLDRLDDGPSASTSTDTGLKSLDEALESRAGDDLDTATDATDDDYDAVDEWDVGPGRPGLVTFGAAGRPGVVGTALFFGDATVAFDDDDDDAFAFE